jgi:hypothetical protein
MTRFSLLPVFVCVLCRRSIQNPVHRMPVRRPSTTTAPWKSLMFVRFTNRQQSRVGWWIRSSVHLWWKCDADRNLLSRISWRNRWFDSIPRIPSSIRMNHDRNWLPDRRLLSGRPGDRKDRLHCLREVSITFLIFVDEILVRLKNRLIIKLFHYLIR